MVGLDLSKKDTISDLLNLLEKQKYFSELQLDGAYSSPTLQKTLKQLLEYRLAEKTLEKPEGRGNPRTVYTLTARGNRIALKLREIDAIASTREKTTSLFQGLYQSLLEHVNVMENMVRIQDGNRIAEIYLKEVQGWMRLRCELCESEECVHVNFAWSLPEVRALI